MIIKFLNTVLFGLHLRHDLTKV